MCNEVGKYIDTLLEDLQIQTLEVEGQILSHTQLHDEIGIFVVNPTKVASRLHESMFHLDYKMHPLVDMSMDLEVRVEGLCSMRCMEINDRMK